MYSYGTMAFWSNDRSFRIGVRTAAAETYGQTVLLCVV